jgi:hypothetical protein
LDASRDIILSCTDSSSSSRAELRNASCIVSFSGGALDVRVAGSGLRVQGVGWRTRGAGRGTPGAGFRV